MNRGDRSEEHMCTEVCTESELSTGAEYAHQRVVFSINDSVSGTCSTDFNWVPDISFPLVNDYSVW